MGVFVDRTGQVYGQLTVLCRDDDPPTKDQGAYWYCRCDACGSVKSFRGTNLTSRNTTSCCGAHKQSRNSYRWTGHGDISGAYWGSIRRDARKRGLPVEVSIEDIWALFLQQGKKCALTGQPLVMHTPGKTYSEASLDRVDSSQGYVPGNLQWVHKKVNQIKMDLEQQEFIAICRAVVAHNTEEK